MRKLFLILCCSLLFLSACQKTDLKTSVAGADAAASDVSTGPAGNIATGITDATKEQFQPQSREIPGAKQMEGDQGSQSQAENPPQKPQKNIDPAAQKLLDGQAGKCAQKKDSGQAFSCFEDFVKSEVKTGGPQLAFQDLKLLYNVDPVAKAFCHPLAHAIGHAAVDKYPKISEAYKHGDAFCWSGYYHGVMEEISERIGIENLPKKLNEICADIPGKEVQSFDYYNCVHGLGHGLMAVTQDQLFDSLAYCDNLTGHYEKESCYGGVYMENVIVDNLNHHTDFLKPDKPLYPCTAVKKQYKDACYLMQTSYVLKLIHYDFAKGFEICANTPDQDFVDTCYRSLGRDASGTTSSNLVRTRANCFYGKGYRQRSQCIIGAVKDFISYFHSDTQAKELCKSLQDADLTSICLETVKVYYKSF